MLVKDSIRPESLFTAASFTRPALLVPRLRERETAGVIKELSQCLHLEGCVPDLLSFSNAALKQELLVNTAIESGMAFPHVRLAGLPRLIFALGRSEVPLPWGPRGTQTVRLVFLLGVPATDAGHYILLLSGLARLSRQPELLQRLQAAPDSLAMHELLGEVRLQTARSPGV